MCSAGTFGAWQWLYALPQTRHRQTVTAEAATGGLNCRCATTWVNDHPCCWELTTLWVARLNNGAELKVTDPKEQQ